MKPAFRREEGSPVIRFIQLLYFAEIVDRGSFSAAARSLYVSQSALSQSVAGLEEELGTELIRRSRSGVRLTYFGHRVYEEAKGLIDAYQRFDSDLRALLSERSEVRGEVSIRCTPGGEDYLSETIVPELSAAYPGVELLISPSPDMRQGFDSFLKGGCALGMGACLGDAWDAVRSEAGAAGLVCEFFGSERPQVLLSARNPLAGGAALGRAELAQLKLVCYSSNPAPRYLSLFQGTAARAPNKESVVRLVAGSDFAGVFTPSGIRRELSEFRGRVRLLPMDVSDDSVQRVVHYLIHAPDSTLRRAELCTLELLRRYPYGE